MTNCPICGKKISQTKGGGNSFIVIDGVAYCLNCKCPPTREELAEEEENNKKI